MKTIRNIVNASELHLTWQAIDDPSRARFVVGKIRKIDDTYTLQYLTDTTDFNAAKELGFEGYPGFLLSKGEVFKSQVVEAFERRLPSSKRGDYPRYLKLKGLSSDVETDRLTMLGYLGAKLPDDGFELVHPFDTAEPPFEMLIEIVGFRHCSEVPSDLLQVGQYVNFSPEPENDFDKDAIRIEFESKKLGYVDRGRTGLFHSILSKGWKLSGEVVRKNGSPERPIIYLYVQITK